MEMAPCEGELALRPGFKPTPHAAEPLAVTEQLAPGLLVASPSLRCPFFNHTVVLLVDHGGEGSFGFVINKLSPIDFATVVAELELEGKADSFDVPVLQGGPVSPETGWVVFDPREAPEVPDDSILLTDYLAVTASMTMLESIARGHAPKHAMLSLGYSGWGEDQLEDEMREGSWIPVDLGPEILYDVPSEERWERALRQLGIDPARVVGRDVAQA